MSGPARLPLNERSSSVSAEGAARANASRQRSGQELDAPATGFSADRAGQGDRAMGGAGEPLGRAQRGEMEARFGRDFSNVRVHANAAEADAMGARAFAQGDHIAFARGESPDKDRSLLAHELTHTVQQAEAGRAQVQMEPKKGAGGIGNAPPSEPFSRADTAGPEDDAVLFDVSQATLSGAALTAIRKLAAGQSGPVLVEVHGYASSEGELEYNVNLSAHRAAAVKAEILRLLPEGSTATLVAHGETSDFGPAAKNRRAGFKVLPRPAAPGKETPSRQPRDAAGDAPKTGAHLDPTLSSVRLFPPLTLSDAPLIPPRSTFVPQLGPATSIDWLVMRNKWAIYGLALDHRTAGDIESYARLQWNASFGFWTSLGLHRSDAIKLADALQPIALGVATSGYLTNNFPTQWDLMDRQLKGTYPGSWQTPQLPITDVIDFLYQKKTGKKDKYLFRF